jgi:hypothetical protein
MWSYHDRQLSGRDPIAGFMVVGALFAVLAMI